jgi:hypothetical protein
MQTSDLTKNKERIIKKIKTQITLATKENILGVMNKMVAMLPQFADDKATMGNIDKLTIKATLSYIKHDLVFTKYQSNVIDARLEENRNASLPSNLQY